MIDRFKSFPPGRNNIQIPIHRKAATLAGLATYGPNAARAVWAQRTAWALVTLGGPRLLPGRSRGWTPPLPEGEWRQMLEELAGFAGPFDSHTVYERRDDRAGLLMLLLDGDRSAGFVKARRGAAGGLERERTALELAERTSGDAFVTPRVLGAGAVADWHFLVTSPMPPRMHRAPRGMPSTAVLDGIQTVLAGLGRPVEVAKHWEPFHGDFTPWNLRRVGDGALWLIDWEDAGWAPPDADRVFYVASAAAIGSPVTTEPLGHSEAAAYWWDEINRRTRQKLAGGVELGRIDYGMLDALAAGKG